MTERELRARVERKQQPPRPAPHLLLKDGQVPSRCLRMQAEVDRHAQRDAEKDRPDRDVIRLLREVGEEAERLDGGDAGGFEQSGCGVRDGFFVEREGLAFARVGEGAHAAEGEDDVVEQGPRAAAGSRNEFRQLRPERRFVDDWIKEVEVVEVGLDVARHLVREDRRERVARGR